MALNLEDIRSLFQLHGSLAYSGEPVTQLEHALQCGTLAQAEGAHDHLVCTAFLHDLGHLLVHRANGPADHDVDDVHQYCVLPFLRPVLPDAVLEPIRLHVDAKRYLCLIDAEYASRLSADSVRSLRLQGGIFSRDEAIAFMRKPFAEEALRLRRWDDEAKQAGYETPPLEHFIEVVARVMNSHEKKATAGHDRR
ncbi:MULTISPECIES: phosphonate degradation HD-domain oxygenase [Burkholderia]|uniref:phosphonate degradation HD-domain oxygenase n=1 Tax=Burkholderia TaxID=32008 RepID=UPI0008422751|nr:MULTISPECIES: phosphonate degradation HD-domain oxygenase [unclassified Burkholderia]AOK31883.1 phosphohydrolase [Burkholderia sp. Bp7605]